MPRKTWELTSWGRREKSQDDLSMLSVAEFFNSSSRWTPPGFLSSPTWKSQQIQIITNVTLA